MDLLFSEKCYVCMGVYVYPIHVPNQEMIKQHDLLNKLAELIDIGKLKTTLTERLEPINAMNLRLVHEKIETGKSIGKIVLENFQ